MPPSTVFSYWRRDHRRTSPAPGSASPIGRPYSPTTFADAPPRLPGLPATTTTTTTTFSGMFIESPQDHVGASPAPPLPSQKQQQHLQETTGADKRLSAAALSSQHSYNNLRVPSAPTDNPVRPHSSPGNTAQHEELSPESAHSGQPLSPNGQPDMHSQKPNGSWRLGFNRNSAHSLAEDQKDTRPSKAAGIDLRINTNVEGGVGFIGGVSLKEMKTESVPFAGHHEQQEPATQQQQQQPKHGKTKRHLLNPMTLLARRRSSQIASSRLDEGSIGYANLVPAIPDDYDPRIRGNIVHDFSAPRPRPQLSGRDSSMESSKKSSVPSSAVTRHSEHSPVFKEHFEEDRKPLQVESKGFLQSSLLTDAGSTDHDPADLPEFARKLPSSLPELDDNQSTVEQNDAAVLEAPLPASSIQPTPRSSPKKSIESASQPASSIPMRLKSDASRFSFDMNGVGSSAQEKLLEENYKEKEAARREEARQNRSSFSDYDDDDFDYDAMEDDGGFEERIPGINADAEDMDDQFQDFSGVVRTSEPSFIPILPTIAASPISPSYPESAMVGAVGNAQINVNNGGVVSSNLSRSSSTYSRHEDVQKGSEALSGPYAVLATEQTAIGTLNTNNIDETKLQLEASVEENNAHNLDDYDDDDMYFDDGEFGDLPENENNATFDESIFDNDNGQLYERKFYPGTKIPVKLQGGEEEEGKEDVPVQRLESGPSTQSQVRHVPSLVSEFRPESWDFGNQIASKLSSSEVTKVPGGVLSEHNLEAFHSALARVADEAAAAGNLQRNTSLSETSLGQGSNSQLIESHPGLISDDNRLSQATGFEDVLDDFNYDDDDGFDDDLIIAEANADALENDDEGFYGQEFGFYAQSSENCNDEPIYGGYFGTQGPGSLNRSHSGGANFREPSLTPITERSEWSTRNSIISLTALGPAAVQPNPLANPGLSQLVDMEYNDEDMSLGALLKLRRGAFGGSNGSLRSSTGSLSPQPAPVGTSNRASFLSIPEDSPVELNSNNTELGFQLPEPSRRLSHNQSSSPLSDRNSLPGSPTMTLDWLTGGETRSSVGDGERRQEPQVFAQQSEQPC
ncbi:hypothetical protein UA08_04684 [Talaromyces atroroseus]|uniref:AGC-kinase C-terminal domain-containing protein n=1 Tax=Talaromyces atroroseus TaxID=1441469 RepID=A0A225B204_TALAT|nr:hypothetical protein UA08_04684 [Talaromyces atroroseus]OKL59867.1 hypothetical protein UA08_04684 [Talaromyces atroroseus]